jgi:hypothetical protein
MICAAVAATRLKGTEPRAGKTTRLPGEKKAILRKGFPAFGGGKIIADAAENLIGAVVT